MFLKVVLTFFYVPSLFSSFKNYWEQKGVALVLKVISFMVLVMGRRYL